LVEKLLVPFEASDVFLLVEKLRAMYSEGDARLTLAGIKAKPYPILRIGGRLVRGLPVSDSRLKYLEPIQHRRRVAAVDASIKTLFDLGSARIVESKVVAGVWRGFERESVIGPYKRLALVRDKEEAGEWLLRVELEFAYRVAQRLRAGDYLLLDRGLAIPPYLKDSTVRTFNKLERLLVSKGVVLVGISKKCRIKLNTGESLIGYVVSLAERRLPGVSWYYYPVFSESAMPEWMYGEIVIAKFSEFSEAAFRVDLSEQCLRTRDMERVMGELAFIQDLATPGYPYPLKAVHDMSRIGDHEADLDRLRLLEIIRREKLDKFFAADLQSTAFKEKYLWGDLF